MNVFFCLKTWLVKYSTAEFYLNAVRTSAGEVLADLWLCQCENKDLLCSSLPHQKLPCPEDCASPVSGASGWLFSFRSSKLNNQGLVLWMGHYRGLYLRTFNHRRWDSSFESSHPWGGLWVEHPHNQGAKQTLSNHSERVVLSVLQYFSSLIVSK